MKTIRAQRVQIRLPNKLLAACGILAALCSGSTSAWAHAVLTIKGTVFSILHDEFVIQSGRELFYLKKDALAPQVREILEKASAHEFTVDVPMNAIDRVRTDKLDEKKRGR